LEHGESKAFMEHGESKAFIQQDPS